MHEILRYQWEDVALPDWGALAKEARANGVEKICIEQHAHQLVYNTETAPKLGEVLGELVGVNFDPSHALWMGGDPLRAIRQLQGAIYHVHAKDTRIDPRTTRSTPCWKPNRMTGSRNAPRIM